MASPNLLELSPEDQQLVNSATAKLTEKSSATALKSDRDIQKILPELLSTEFKYPYFRPLYPLYLIQGTPKSDYLTDTRNNDLILARGGDDYVIAWRGGSDQIYGEEGNDFLFAGAGDDYVYGGKGNDRIYGSSGNDYLYGDPNYDYYFPSYSPVASASVVTTASLKTKKASFDSRLYKPNPSTGSGDDCIYGGTGNDYIYGGGGNDYIDGGSDNDVIYGDSGSKYFFYPDLDVWSVYSYPVGGNDTIKGGNGNDIIYGEDGNDSIYGGSGNDYLNGGSGNKEVSDRDTLTGGKGADKFVFKNIFTSVNNAVTGGNGADKFVFYNQYSEFDVIADFNSNEGDQIQVSRNAFSSGTFYSYVDNVLTPGILKEEQFTLGISAKDANDRFIYNNKTGDLFLDIDGNGFQEQVQFAQLSGAPSLTYKDIFII